MPRLNDDCYALSNNLMALEDAQALLAKSITPVADSEEVSLEEALGRTLAFDLIAQENVPPFKHSSMDGYALNYEDLNPSGKTTLPIRGRVAAGHVLGRRGQTGETVRIFTGAPIPEGFDTVVMQENVELDEQGNAIFQENCVSKQGANCRPMGEDITKGTVALKKGRKITSPDLGLACAVGYESLSVIRKLKVGLFSTGDEIRDAGVSLGGGAIYDMNRYTLRACLQKLGCEVTDLGILPDDAQTIEKNLVENAAQFDLLLTSGGVSVGEEDHVRAVLEKRGRLTFWNLAIKPGKPVALGEIGSTAFIGLPGKPVSSLITYMFIVRPFLEILGGGHAYKPLSFQVPAAFEYRHRAGKKEWLRAFIKHTPYGDVVELFPKMDSGVLSSLVKSDGLIAMPQEGINISAGDMVRFIPLSELGLS